MYVSEKAMAPHSSTLAWKIPWTEEPGRLQSMGSLSQTWLSDFPFTFHFLALEKEMATHSSVLAWRIPGTGEPIGLPSMGSHRVGHDWSNLAAAAAAYVCMYVCMYITIITNSRTFHPNRNPVPTDNNSSFLPTSSPKKLLFYFLHLWICVFWKPHEWNHRILILSCLACFHLA